MRAAAAAGPSLRETLNYLPVELAFGTSGLRGLVSDLSQLEAYVNTRGFLAYLLARRLTRRGGTVCCAGDLRPSTDRLVPEQGGRGEIIQAVLRAVEEAGMKAAFLGRLPSPALMAYALRLRAASVMVTGSQLIARIIDMDGRQLVGWGCLQGDALGSRWLPGAEVGSERKTGPWCRAKRWDTGTSDGS